jgi:hypothetical protein
MDQDSTVDAQEARSSQCEGNLTDSNTDGFEEIGATGPKEVARRATISSRTHSTNRALPEVMRSSTSSVPACC